MFVKRKDMGVVTISLKEQAAAKLNPAPEDLEKWQTLVGGSGFSAVYHVVQVMAAARRWPQLMDRVYLASLEFTFLKFDKLPRGLDLVFAVDERRRGWFWYSFAAQSADTRVFSGSAVFCNQQQSGTQNPLRPVPTAENVCRLALTEHCLEQYLAISGDPNPIHRRGSDSRAPVYPGLLVLGQVEAALKSCLNILLPAMHETKVRFCSPVFVGETINIRVLPRGELSFEISAGDRVAATVSCKL